MSLILATALLGTLNYGAVAVANISGSSVSGQDNDVPAVEESFSQSVPVSDQRFLEISSADNLEAIAALDLISTRGNDPALRDEARRLADARGRLQVNIEVLAIRKDIDIPRRPTRSSLATLARLAQLDGETLDKAWTLYYTEMLHRTSGHIARAKGQLHDHDVRDFAFSQTKSQARTEQSSVEPACACGPLTRR